jgi:DNA sulfur modification protein DndB
MTNPGYCDYTFWVIKGVLGESSFFSGVVPVEMFVNERLFVYNDPNVPDEHRYQRDFNEGNAAQIAKYLSDKFPKIFSSSIVCVIPEDSRFEPLEDNPLVGRIIVPGTSIILVNDGQHRQRAWDSVMKNDPKPGQTLPVIFYIFTSYEDCQQLFKDLNCGVRPSNSLAKLFEHRESDILLAKGVKKRLPLYDGLILTTRDTIPAKGKQLFTLTHFTDANALVVQHIQHREFEYQLEACVAFWDAIADNMPQWNQVYKSELSGNALRKDEVSTLAITLMAFGYLGQSLVVKYAKELHTLKKVLRGLKNIGWHRNNPAWRSIFMTQTDAMKTPKISNRPETQRALAAYFKRQLNLED